MIVTWKDVLKTVWHYTVVMWWNLGFLATAPVIFIGPLSPKTRSTHKKTPWKRLPKGNRFKSLQMLRYRSWPSSIHLHSILQQRINGDFQQDLLHFLWWNFLRVAGPINRSGPFLESVDKKNLQHQIWDRGRKHKIANS